MARVEVIVPTFNRCSELDRALLSVSKQHFRDLRVIVSDDGSTDFTDDVLDRWAERLNLLVVKGQNSGRPAVARNRALDRADGEFVAFLDSDDWWTEDKLWRCLAEATDDTDFIYHDLSYVGSPHGTLGPRRVKTRVLDEDARNALLYRGNGIATSGVVYRQAGTFGDLRFDESSELCFGEDFFFWLSLAERGCRFKKASGCLGFYSFGDGLTQPENIVRFCQVVTRQYFRDEARVPTWLSYLEGRAQLDLGNVRRARQLLRASLGQNGPPRTWREFFGAWVLLLRSSAMR